nr:PREDICTED: uncharacterized protein LOC104150546 isoform X2 [Struthio camelus australis]
MKNCNKMQQLRIRTYPYEIKIRKTSAAGISEASQCRKKWKELSPTQHSHLEAVNAVEEMEKPVACSRRTTAGTLDVQGWDRMEGWQALSIALHVLANATVKCPGWCHCSLPISRQALKWINDTEVSYSLFFSPFSTFWQIPGGWVLLSFFITFVLHQRVEEESFLFCLSR